MYTVFGPGVILVAIDRDRIMIYTIISLQYITHVIICILRMNLKFLIYSRSKIVKRYTTKMINTNIKQDIYLH